MKEVLSCLSSHFWMGIIPCVELTKVSVSGVTCALLLRIVEGRTNKLLVVELEIRTLIPRPLTPRAHRHALARAFDLVDRDHVIGRTTTDDRRGHVVMRIEIELHAGKKRGGEWK